MLPKYSKMDTTKIHTPFSAYLPTAGSVKAGTREQASFPHFDQLVIPRSYVQRTVGPITALLCDPSRRRF